jgi:hypothetical protein
MANIAGKGHTQYNTGVGGKGSWRCP